MLKTVRDTIAEQGLLPAGSRCLAAVSGGADSVSLLSALHALKDEFGIHLRAIHVNHCLRGAESDRDARFVAEYCRSLGIPLQAVKVDVISLSASKRISTEEAARLLRYEAFEQTAQAWEREEPGPAVLVAVAHNRDDNAETILMHLARGSGLKGASGMSFRRDRYIRPLLEVSRAEIEQYLSENHISYVTDSTNLSCDYARNRIRHDIMPRIREEVNAGAVLNITRAGRMIGQADAYIRSRAEELLEGPFGMRPYTGEYLPAAGNACGKERLQGYAVPLRLLKEQPGIVQTYMIRSVISRLISTMKDVSAKHAEDAVSLIKAEYGKRIDLPYGLEAVRDYRDIVIKFKDRKPETDERPLQECFTFRFFDYSGQTVPDEPCRKWFDADLTGMEPEIRYRRRGDYLTLNKTGKKMLGAYMTDIKISRELRDKVPVLATGSHVIWLVGYRISESFKVSEHTARIMEVIYGKEQYDERKSQGAYPGGRS